MKIIQITPGSGESFYCENCLRDNSLLKALRKGGHETLMIPMYLPPSSDGVEMVQTAPIFFGGINVYLQQKSALFRHTPRWIDRLFDWRRLLDWAARRAGMTHAGDLAEATLSILRGEQGRQRKELKRLVTWVKSQGRPDVVCLSDALLVGLARTIKAELTVPIVCLLQDEDEFLDALEEADRARAWAALARRAGDVDFFIAASREYAARMTDRLGLSADRVEVIYSGIDVEGYAPAPQPPQRPTIGFLSRMCYGKGLDLLVEAFAALKADKGLKDLRLRACGGMTSADRTYVEGIAARLARAGLLENVEFLPNLPQPQRVEFLRSLWVLSVPERTGEAAGRYVKEALACGVPVVQPANGVFPELIEATGGGLLFEPRNVDSLVAQLRRLLLEPALAQSMGRQGRQAVLEKFNVELMARQYERVYSRLVERNP